MGDKARGGQGLGNIYYKLFTINTQSAQVSVQLSEFLFC